MIQNRNVFLYAQNAIDPIEQIDFSNSTMLFSTNNLTSIASYSPSGSGSFTEIGSGDFSGSGSGDGEFASYQPLTCTAPDGIKSEAITSDTASFNMSLSIAVGSILIVAVVCMFGYMARQIKNLKLKLQQTSNGV